MYMQKVYSAHFGNGHAVVRIQYGEAFPVAHLKVGGPPCGVDASGLDEHSITMLIGLLKQVRRQMIVLHEQEVE